MQTSRRPTRQGLGTDNRLGIAALLFDIVVPFSLSLTVFLTYGSRTLSVSLLDTPFVRGRTHKTVKGTYTEPPSSGGRRNPPSQGQRQASGPFTSMDRMQEASLASSHQRRRHSRAATQLPRGKTAPEIRALTARNKARQARDQPTQCSLYQNTRTDTITYIGKAELQRYIRTNLPDSLLAPVPLCPSVPGVRHTCDLPSERWARYLHDGVLLDALAPLAEKLRGIYVLLQSGTKPCHALYFFACPALYCFLNRKNFIHGRSGARPGVGGGTSGGSAGKSLVPLCTFFLTVRISFTAGPGLGQGWEVGPRGGQRVSTFFACPALYFFLNRNNFIHGRSRARSTHPRGGRWDLGGVGGLLRPAPKTFFEKKKKSLHRPSGHPPGPTGPAGAGLAPSLVSLRPPYFFSNANNFVSFEDRATKFGGSCTYRRPLSSGGSPVCLAPAVACRETKNRSVNRKRTRYFVSWHATAGGRHTCDTPLPR